MKKVPLRMCSGCGEMKPKAELMRVVKSPEGVVSEDITGKKQGRGAYLCKNADCLKKAIKTRRIERALSSKIPVEIYEKIEKSLNGGKADGE